MWDRWPGVNDRRSLVSRWYRKMIDHRPIVAVLLTHPLVTNEILNRWEQSHCRGQGFDSPRLHHATVTDTVWSEMSRQ